MMLYLRLFFEFFKTGLFAVGGGMATLPFMYDISDRTGWFTHAQLADMIAVSESTPGPIGVNMATYVGFATGGVPGAIVATLGVITPSVIVILIVARILKSFRENVYVDSAFYGLRPERRAGRSVQSQGVGIGGGAAGTDALDKADEEATPDIVHPVFGRGRSRVRILSQSNKPNIYPSAAEMAQFIRRPAKCRPPFMSLSASTA